MALSLQIDTSQPIHQQYIPFNQDHLMERIILPLPLAVPNYLVNFLGPPTSCRHSLGGVLQNVISRLLYLASRLTNMAFALFLLVPLPPFVADEDAGNKERDKSLDCSSSSVDDDAALTTSEDKMLLIPVPLCLTGWISLLSLSSMRMIQPSSSLLTLHCTRRFVSLTIVITLPLLTPLPSIIMMTRATSSDMLHLTMVDVGTCLPIHIVLCEFVQGASS